MCTRARAPRPAPPTADTRADRPKPRRQLKNRGRRERGVRNASAKVPSRGESAAGVTLRKLSEEQPLAGASGTNGARPPEPGRHPPGSLFDRCATPRRRFTPHDQSNMYSTFLFINPHPTPELFQLDWERCANWIGRVTAVRLGRDIYLVLCGSLDRQENLVEAKTVIMIVLIPTAACKIISLLFVSSRLQGNRPATS
ncbi:hypothetical protein EVAR_47411_1 [Eumeta japonica]|uniref:Uncharacterized protein n=1 Tax=Eumeta variegata TaxID=151549 RepID=A0A4C1XZR7_EUMVA|nr:hypothetical protein EVAR_47411_1 [Eumeta japonica]